MQHVAVLDLETTGLYRTDRVVEVGVVRLDQAGTVVSEFATLVNPCRDVGPTSRHGITASMVAQAPTFDEIAAAVASHLHGAVLAGHNIAFDRRMLGQELERLNAEWDFGTPVCTMSWAAETFGAGRSLSACCQAAKITHNRPHSALDDARAASELLLACRQITRDDRCRSARPIHAPVDQAWTRLPRTWRRSTEFTPTPSYLSELVASVRAGAPADWAYLALVDEVIADLVVSSEEAAALRALATELGYAADDVDALHREYYDALVDAAVRDSVVHDEELDALERAAAALGVDPSAMRARVSHHRPVGGSTVHELAGKRICFTGDWDGEHHGERWSRALAHELANDAGAIPVAGVTKRTDVLVAADTATASGKARRARELGIPILAVEDFLSLLDQPRL